MATQPQIDAAFAAVMPLVDAKITDEEAQVPIFVRHTAVEQIAAHKAEIEAFLRQILPVAIDAAVGK